MMNKQPGETKSSEDGMRTRVRLFAEGVVKMASPVLLALGLRKVNLRGEGTWFVRASISTLAGLAMTFGILLMVFLWLRLSKLVEGLKRMNYAASKLFVHLCAILLMSLASEILVLISVRCQLYVVSAPPLVLLVVFCYLWSWRRDEARDAAMLAVARCDRDLENSVDFSAGLTTLVFLGLERLALEVHLTTSSSGSGRHSGTLPDDHLESSLALSFTTCVIGVVIMLLWTTPPPIRNYEGCIELCNVVLALFITAITVQITWAPLKAVALWVIVPPLISLLYGMYKHFDFAGEQDQGGQRQKGDVTVHPNRVDIEQPQPQPPLDDSSGAAGGGGDGDDGSPQGGHQPQDHVEEDGKTKQVQLQCNQQPQVQQQGKHGGQPQGVNDGLQDNDNQQQTREDQDPQMVKMAQRQDGRIRLKDTQQGQPQGDQQADGGMLPVVSDDGISTVTQTTQQPPLPSDNNDSEVKPPSLELMKFAFAGFLTVSIPSISTCSPLSVWTHAFILLTALSVVSALVWRLLGHRAKPSRAEVAAANIASSFAHLFAISALVPFALMADRNARLAVPTCPQN